MEILNLNDYLNERAMTKEERKAKRKERREAKKRNLSKAGSNRNIEDIDDEINPKNFKASRSMTASVERVRTETLKFQDLQKEFVLTPKNNVAKREILKKKLIAQSAIVKKAEADFERHVSAEEEDFAQDLFFENFNITEYLKLEELSRSELNKMNSYVNTKSVELFNKSAIDIAKQLVVEGYEVYEIGEFLNNLISNLIPAIDKEYNSFLE